MSAYLHRHGKERRGTTGDGGTQITCRPSFSQAHRRRARSPAAKLYICTYTYTPNICIYISPTETFFLISQRMQHYDDIDAFCVCASAECVCVNLCGHTCGYMYCIRVYTCPCASRV